MQKDIAAKKPDTPRQAKSAAVKQDTPKPVKSETPEKAAARKRATRRQAPKAARENGGWTYNRLGTRQIKVCKW
jgi:hypothetical protein